MLGPFHNSVVAVSPVTLLFLSRHLNGTPDPNMALHLTWLRVPQKCKVGARGESGKEERLMELVSRPPCWEIGVQSYVGDPL